MATPSLLIIPDRFKAAKLYSQLPESGAGDFTVTRGTTATRVNASGLIESVASGVPRLDYTGGGCPSLLVEPAATNLLLRSEEFDNASWTKNGLAIVANAVIAPNGTLTADEVNSTTTGSLDVRVTSSIAVSGNFTVSRYVKKRMGVTWVNAPVGIGNGNAWFNLDNGTVGTVQSNILSANIFPLENGWFKIVMTSNFTGNLAIRALGFSDTNGVTTYTGAIGDGVYLWGAQLEVGSVATSYIPTVASTVTRNADVISLSSVSGLIGQTEGVFFVDFVAEAPSEVRRISLSDGTNANRVFIGQQSNGTIQFFISVSSSSQVNFITSTSYTNGTRLKIALAYKENDFVGYINGAQIFTDNLGTVPATSKFAFADATDISTFRARISAAAIYTERLSNAELAQLTTL